MINFGKIKYKNILSVGNKPIELDFLANKKLLITGSNGGGKSTMIEALSFVLYGKPFRNVTKNSIVNSINKRELLVNLEFKERGDSYTISRGIKPNIFEITKNGVVVDATGKSLDYQEWFETNVLKMNFSTFKQIIVLGTAGFEPFMDLATAKRRTIVEDLLDIGVFSVMGELNKNNIKTTKNEMSLDENKLNSLTTILDVQEKNSSDVQSQYQEQIDRLTVKRGEYSTEINKSVELAKIEKVALEEIESKYNDKLNLMETNYLDDIKFIENDKKVIEKNKNDNITLIKAVEDKHLKLISERETNDKSVRNETVSTYKLNLSTLKDENTKKLMEYNLIVESTINDLTKKLEDEINSKKEFNKNILSQYIELSYKKPVLDLEMSSISESTFKMSDNNKTLSDNKKRLDFFDHTIQCPTCDTNLDEKYKAKIVKMLTDENKSLVIKNEKIKSDIEKLKKYIDECEEKYKISQVEIGNKTIELDNSLDKFINQKTKENDLLIDLHKTKYNKLEKELNDEYNLLDTQQNERLYEFDSDCKQKIFELNKEKSDEVYKLTTKLAEEVSIETARYVTKIHEYKSNYTKFVDDVKTERDIELSPLKEKIVSLTQSAKQNLQFTKELNEEISNLETKKNDLSKLTSELVKVKTEIDEYNGKIKTHKFDLKVKEILYNLLKDDGIKAKIVKQYIPYINSRINYYLKVMGANYNFTLDEEFKETIKSRGREEFVYNSFSQGEKMRIDISIMFTWRDVIRKKTGAISNLLIMDEVMDGASDIDAINSLHNLIDDLKDNVIIISHNDNHELERFSDNIKMVKKGNFSCIA